MKIRSVVVLVPFALAAACDIPPDFETDSPPESTETFRYLPGLRPAAVSETATRAAATAMEAVGSVEAGCRSGATDVVSITADVATAPGEETVLASIPHGIVVLDRAGRVLATARPFPCGGSADEMVSLAAGDLGIGRPVIVAVVTLGGRAEATTWIAVLEVGERRLHRAFSGVLEHRDGDAVQRGAARIIDGTLRYEEPGETPTTWVYVPSSHAFLRRR